MYVPVNGTGEFREPIQANLSQGKALFGGFALFRPFQPFQPFSFSSLIGCAGKGGSKATQKKQSLSNAINIIHRIRCKTSLAMSSRQVRPCIRNPNLDIQMLAVWSKPRSKKIEDEEEEEGDNEEGSAYKTPGCPILPEYFSYNINLNFPKLLSPIHSIDCLQASNIRSNPQNTRGRITPWSSSAHLPSPWL